MYNNKSNNKLSFRRGRHGGGFTNQSRGRGKNGSPRQKYINPSLFVKKAIEPENALYVAKYKFTDFSISAQLKENIRRHGYITPTPIQDQSIGHILAGKDIVGTADTGTGKTAAFLIPLIEKVSQNRSQRILIIVPTRELAGQINDEFYAFSKNLHTSSALCIGGVSISGQIYTLRRNPQFVIGTPGRLKDLEERKVLSFNSFTTIVLDEVDRMLDMGFVHDIKYIMGRIPKPRHTLFFSATMPSEVTTIMKSFVNNPVMVSVKSGGAGLYVDQNVIRTNGKPKVDTLHDLLVQEGFDKVLVFGRTKWGMEKLAVEMGSRGFKVAAIHGNKSQNQRSRAIEQFKANRIQVLLATDVASRGLDINDVTHVINYDLPESYDAYVHRIGRTGRAGKKGTALTFVD